MARTGGRKRLPLPPSVEVDLRRIGFVYREQASEGLSYYIWQHKRWPSMELHVARLNLPGSQHLIWDLNGSIESTPEEEMVRRLERAVDFRTNPNVFLERMKTDG